MNLAAVLNKNKSDSLEAQVYYAETYFRHWIAKFIKEYAPDLNTMHIGTKIIKCKSFVD